MNTATLPHPSYPATSKSSLWSLNIEHQTSALDAVLNLPVDALGVVLLAHAEVGANRKPRNRYLAQCLGRHNLGVLQLELVTATEETSRRGQFQEEHFGLMAERLTNAAQWAHQQRYLHDYPLGCLGFGIGGTVTLMAAGALTAVINAVAVVDTQPELAGDRLAYVSAATLLVVSDTHDVRRRMNEVGYSRLRSEKELKVIPGATALVTGEALEQVVTLTAQWFQQHLEPHNSFALEILGATP